MPPSDLDAALLAAHADGDRKALVALYARAGKEAAAAGREEAAGFYLTHAYVYALEAGNPAAAGLHAELKKMGREE